tara:strand:+ start:358 stop:609 length:252 start_codon:yes stop_codon:yes gene_type:complete
MDEKKVTVAPVLWVGDLVGHPYAEGRGLFDRTDDSDIPDCPVAAATPRLSETPGRLRRQEPKMGEHLSEILSEIASPKEHTDV